MDINRSHLHVCACVHMCAYIPIMRACMWMRVSMSVSMLVYVWMWFWVKFKDCWFSCRSYYYIPYWNQNMWWTTFYAHFTSSLLFPRHSTLLTLISCNYVNNYVSILYYCLSKQTINNHRLLEVSLTATIYFNIQKLCIQILLLDNSFFFKLITILIYK